VPVEPVAVPLVSLPVEPDGVPLPELELEPVPVAVVSDEDVVSDAEPDAPAAAPAAAPPCEELSLEPVAYGSVLDWPLAAEPLSVWPEAVPEVPDSVVDPDWAVVDSLLLGCAAAERSEDDPLVWHATPTTSGSASAIFLKSMWFPS
jgi:hypothetical protein